MKSRIVLAVVGGVLAVVVWGYRAGSQADDLSENVLAASIARISRLDGYEAHENVILGAITEAHEAAFTASYDYGTPGGRAKERKAATFDDDRYLTLFFFNLRLRLGKAIDELPTRTAMAELADFRERVDALRKELGLPDTPRR